MRGASDARSRLPPGYQLAAGYEQGSSGRAGGPSPAKAKKPGCKRKRP